MIWSHRQITFRGGTAPIKYTDEIYVDEENHTYIRQIKVSFGNREELSYPLTAKKNKKAVKKKPIVWPDDRKQKPRVKQLTVEMTPPPSKKKTSRTVSLGKMPFTAGKAQKIRL